MSDVTRVIEQLERAAEDWGCEGLCDRNGADHDAPEVTWAELHALGDLCREAATMLKAREQP